MEVTIHKKGHKPLHFKHGGLHASLGVPMGQVIPEAKRRAAARGAYGAKAKKQEMFAEHVLKH